MPLWQQFHRLQPPTVDINNNNNNNNNNNKKIIPKLKYPLLSEAH